MFGLIRKIFIILLTSIVSASNHTKQILLSNQKCMTQHTFINLHPNEYSQEFHYYPFVVKSNRCVWNYNTLNDISNKICVPNKTEDSNLGLFNMIKEINESKESTKHLSYNVNVDLMQENIIQINDGIMINVNVIAKIIMYAKKIMFGILLHVIVKMDNIYQVLWMIQQLCMLKL